MVFSKAENDELSMLQILDRFNHYIISDYSQKNFSSHFFNFLLTWYQFFIDFLVIIDEGTLTIIGSNVAPIA